MTQSNETAEEFAGKLLDKYYEINCPKGVHSEPWTYPCGKLETIFDHLLSEREITRKETSECFAQYRVCARKLTSIKLLFDDKEVAEEEALLEEMDVLWWKLSKAERALVDREYKTKIEEKERRGKK